MPPTSPAAPGPPPASPAGGPAAPAEYAAIFDQPKNPWLKTLLIGLIALIVLVGIAGAVNRFVFDFGLGEFIPFFAQPAGKTPEVTGPQTSEVEEAEETIGAASEAKERDLQRKADLALVQSALVVYQQQKGAFPTTVGRVKLNEPGNSLELALVPTFLVNIPKDPQDPQFSYQYQSDGATYSLTAIIEDSSDPQAISGGTYYYYQLTPVSSTPATTPSSP